MKRALKLIGVLAAVQALLVAGYTLLREDGPVERPGQLLDRPAPELVYETPDGAERRLSELRGRPVVVHFWATWCGPCKEELPSLLAFSAETGARVLAVSTDPGWPAIRRFFGGEPPGPVARTSPDAATRDFGVATLPETFVVDRAGRIRLRFEAARDWSDEAVRDAVEEIGAR